MSVLQATPYLDVVTFVFLVLALRNSSMPMGIRWSMSAIVATAMSSLSLIATLVFTGTSTWLPVFWMIYLIPTVLLFRDLGWEGSAVTEQGPLIRPTSWLAAASTVCAILAVAVALYINRYGGWDAWAIWNLKARFLFYGVDDGAWIGLLASEINWSHPDYPLLLPATVARYWLSLGAPATWVPATVGILTLGLTLYLIHRAVRSCSGRLMANMSVVVLLSATFFVQHAASQFADNYLALLVLAAGVVFRQLISTHRLDINGWGTPYLLGLLLGLAASTKNEGLLITIVFLGLYLVAVVFRRGRDLSAAVAPTLVMASAWVLVYFPSMVMKHQASVGNDILASISRESIQHSMSWERISTLFQLINPLIADFFLVPTIIIVAMVFGFYGRCRFSLADNSMLLTAPVLILGGYILVLWFTPHDLEWHVTSSFQRLLVHFWGLLVFVLASSSSISRVPDVARAPHGHG